MIECVDHECGSVEIVTDATPDAVRAKVPHVTVFGETLCTSVAVLGETVGGTRYRVTAPWPRSEGWPQLDPRIGAGWAVLPLWALLAGYAEDEPIRVGLRTRNAVEAWPDAPLNRSALLPYAVLSGLRDVTPTTAATHLMLVPEAAESGLVAIVDPALAALEARFGALPVERTLISVEPQRRDTGREKGYAHHADDLLYARLIYRVATDGRVAAPRDLQDLVVHELLHHHLPTEAPAGSWLVEGLVTYLARRILSEAGLADDATWNGWRARAHRDLAENPQTGKLALSDAAERFGEAHVPNFVYAKGFLLGEALDARLDGRLGSIARSLVSDRGTITPDRFVQVLPEPVRRAYARWHEETGMPAFT